MRSGGVEGGSSRSEDGWVDSCETADARRVASDAAEDCVSSRAYATTSQLCSVASGLKDTRRRAAVMSVH